jgi:hypothetical protein
MLTRVNGPNSRLRSNSELTLKSDFKNITINYFYPYVNSGEWSRSATQAQSQVEF